MRLCVCDIPGRQPRFCPTELDPARVSKMWGEKAWWFCVRTGWKGKHLDVGESSLKSGMSFILNLCGSRTLKMHRWFDNRKNEKPIHTCVCIGFKMFLEFAGRIYKIVTLNKEIYIDILLSLRDAVRRKVSEKWRTSSWFLLHDHVTAHRSVLVKDFLARNNVTTLDHPHNLLAWTSTAINNERKPLLWFCWHH